MRSCYTDMPSKEVLTDLYIGKKLSLFRISSIFNKSTRVVTNWLRFYNIAINIGASQIYEDLRSIPLSKEQIDVIVGSMLGDGHMRIPKRCINAVFSESHSVVQKEYLEWKKNILFPFARYNTRILSGGDCVIDGIKCKRKDSYRFETIAHPQFKIFWNMFYRKEFINSEFRFIKTVPDILEDYFNDLVLAIWLMDDGSFMYSNKYRIYRFHIYTDSFSYDDNMKLVNILKGFFDGNINIYSRPSIRKFYRYFITLTGKKSIENLCDRLINYAVNCMKYKFDYGQHVI